MIVQQAFILTLVLSSMTRKRKLDESAEVENYVAWSRQRTRKRVEELNDDADEYLTATMASAEVLGEPKVRKPRGMNRNRQVGKGWWIDGYARWSELEFKENLRVERKTFEYILLAIRPFIEKQPTNFNRHPISSDRQLALTLYRLARGEPYVIIGNLFGVSVPLASSTFNKVCKIMVRELYDVHVRMPSTDQEWEAEIRGFIENYEFPCVAAWDGFHVYVCSKLKNFFSFKKRYSTNNLGLVGYNKRFLNAVIGAPGKKLFII